MSNSEPAQNAMNEALALCPYPTHDPRTLAWLKGYGKGYAEALKYATQQVRELLEPKGVSK